MKVLKIEQNRVHKIEKRKVNNRCNEKWLSLILQHPKLVNELILRIKTHAEKKYNKWPVSKEHGRKSPHKASAKRSRLRRSDLNRPPPLYPTQSLTSISLHSSKSYFLPSTTNAYSPRSCDRTGSPSDFSAFLPCWSLKSSPSFSSIEHSYISESLAQYCRQPSFCSLKYGISCVTPVTSPQAPHLLPDTKISLSPSSSTSWLSSYGSEPCGPTDDTSETYFVKWNDPLNNPSQGRDEPVPSNMLPRFPAQLSPPCCIPTPYDFPLCSTPLSPFKHCDTYSYSNQPHPPQHQRLQIANAETLQFKLSKSGRTLVLPKDLKDILTDGTSSFTTIVPNPSRDCPTPEFDNTLRFERRCRKLHSTVSQCQTTNQKTPIGRPSSAWATCWRSPVKDVAESQMVTLMYPSTRPSIPRSAPLQRSKDPLNVGTIKSIVIPKEEKPLLAFQKQKLVGNLVFRLCYSYYFHKTR